MNFISRLLNKKDDNSNLRAIISDTDTNISEHIRIEAVYIMFELTTIVLWLLNSWTLTKDTPNVDNSKLLNTYFDECAIFFDELTYFFDELIDIK